MDLFRVLRSRQEVMPEDTVSDSTSVSRSTRGDSGGLAWIEAPEAAPAGEALEERAAEVKNLLFPGGRAAPREHLKSLLEKRETQCVVVCRALKQFKDEHMGGKLAKAREGMLRRFNKGKSFAYGHVKDAVEEYFPLALEDWDSLLDPDIVSRNPALQLRAREILSNSASQIDGGIIHTLLEGLGDRAVPFLSDFLERPVELNTILNRLSPAQILDLATRRDPAGRSGWLTMAAQEGVSSVLETVIDRLNGDQLAALALHTDDTGKNWLQEAAARNQTGTVLRLLDSLNSEQALSLLRNTLNYKNHWAVKAAVQGHTEYFEALLKHLSGYQIMDLIQTWGAESGSNLMIHLALNKQSDLLNKIIHKLLPEQLVELARMQDADGTSWMMHAAEQGLHESIAHVVEHLSGEQLYQTTLVVDNDSANWVMDAARNGVHSVSLENLVDKLSLEHFLALSAMKDKEGNGWIDEAHVERLKELMATILSKYSIFLMTQLAEGKHIQIVLHEIDKVLPRRSRLALREEVRSSLREKIPAHSESRMLRRALRENDTETVLEIEALNILEQRGDFERVAMRMTPSLGPIFMDFDAGTDGDLLEDKPEVLAVLNNIAESPLGAYYVFPGEGPEKLAEALCRPRALPPRQYFLTADTPAVVLVRFLNILGEERLSEVLRHTNSVAGGSGGPNIFQMEGGLAKIQEIETLAQADCPLLRQMGSETLASQFEAMAQVATVDSRLRAEYERVPIVALQDIEDIPGMDLPGATAAFLSKPKVFEALPSEVEDDQGIVADADAGSVSRVELVAIANQEIEKYAYSHAKLMSGARLHDEDLPWGMSIDQITQQLLKLPENRGKRASQLRRLAEEKQRLYLDRSIKYLKYIIHTLDRLSEENPVGAAMQVAELLTALRHCEGGRTPALEAMYSRLQGASVVSSSDGRQALLYKAHAIRQAALESVLNQYMREGEPLERFRGESATMLRFLMQQLQDDFGFQGLHLSGELGETGADVHIPTTTLQGLLPEIRMRMNELTDAEHLVQQLCLQAYEDKDFHNAAYNYAMDKLGSTFMAEDEDDAYFACPPYLLSKAGNALTAATPDKNDQYFSPKGMMLILKEAGILL